MKNIKLYNLIKEFEIHDDGMIFIHYSQVEDFFKEMHTIVRFGIDDAKKAFLRDTFLCFNIRSICEDCELDWNYVKENLIN